MVAFSERRDEVHDYVIEHLGDSNGVLIIDDTGFLKKGVKSAGVARQYSGTARRIENCQIGVFLAYRSARGHALIDRQLHLPQAWTDDRVRCRAAGIPDGVGFATKVQMAREMLERAWSRISAGAGAHEPREYWWARVPIRVFWRVGRGHWRLARRNMSTSELAYYVCYGPRKTRLLDLARIAGTRRAVEECFHQAKGQAGLDDYQVRDRRAWYAHIMLSMAAYAWLVVARTLTTKGEPTPRTAG